MNTNMPPSQRYAMRGQLSFVPGQITSGGQPNTVNPNITPSGGEDIRLPNITLPDQNSNSNMYYWIAVIAGGLILYYAIK